MMEKIHRRVLQPLNQQSSVAFQERREFRNSYQATAFESRDKNRKTNWKAMEIKPSAKKDEQGDGREEKEENKFSMNKVKVSSARITVQ